MALEFVGCLWSSTLIDVKRETILSIFFSFDHDKLDIT